MKKTYHWSILLILIPVFFLAMPIVVNNVDFCISRTTHAPITAVNGQDIKGDTIFGGVNPCITVPNGVHDVHIHKNKLVGSTASTGAVYIGSGCYNITVDSNVITTSVRGVFARLSTNNIVVRYNEFLDMADPNIYTNGGGSSVQFNRVSGSGNRINRNYSMHTFTSVFTGDQFSLYQSNGVPGDPIQVDSNQMVNGSSKPEGDVGIDLGDGGGTYQEGKYNYCVNCGSSAGQVSGGFHMDLSFNWAYGAQTTYTNAGFGYNSPGTTTDHTTVTIGNNHSQWTLKNGAVLNYYFDPAVGQPVNWSTNVNDPSLNTSLLPNPLFGSCSVPTKPNVSYPSYIGVYKTAISPVSPVNIGGTATGYTATLPAGLSINASTGVITGTPTAAAVLTNYRVIASNGVGHDTTVFTLTVNKAVLSVIADNKYKVFNTVNPALTISYISSVPGDTSITLTTYPTASTTAITSSPPGAYDIIASGAASPNYTIGYVVGAMVVYPLSVGGVIHGHKAKQATY